MEQAPRPEQEESIENFEFIIPEKSEKVKTDVMSLLHEYPDHFVPGLFEPAAEKDFEESDIAVAYNEGEAMGCLMFNRQTNEYNWLAIKRNIPHPKVQIAKRLFESFYPTIDPGVEVHFFVNTEDAEIPGRPEFSGRKFEAARRLYRAMGLTWDEKDRRDDKYGPGGHAYEVRWIPNQEDHNQ